ncbi:hypothetical protein N9D93_00040 [bacterium]|nr:hypothetical protein [bacterium]
MNINTTKIISLLFFIFSAFYLYIAYQIQVFSFDENAPFNARTFPIYLGYAGLFFSGLKIILPERNTIKVDHNNLEYKKNSYTCAYSNYLWCNYIKDRLFFNDLSISSVFLLCVR